jgi:hypothetical protein
MFTPRLKAMLNNAKHFVLMLVVVAMPIAVANAAGLGGSRASVLHQHDVATRNDFTFLRTPVQVRQLVSKGILVRVDSSTDLRLSGVSFPFTRPEVLLFVDRLAAEYRDANGEALVVTSLTRPLSEQPRNASALSVHPAGIAVDFRIPTTAKEQRWLEARLLELEKKGVLDVTREKHPAHYHVAVFPTAYAGYAATLPPLPPRPTPPAPDIPSSRPVVASSDRIAAITDVPSMPVTMLVGLALVSMLAVSASARRLREKARLDR